MVNFTISKHFTTTNGTNKANETYNVNEKWKIPISKWTLYCPIERYFTNDKCCEICLVYKKGENVDMVEY